MFDWYDWLDWLDWLDWFKLEILSDFVHSWLSSWS